MNVDLNEINSRLTGLDEAAVKASQERWSVVAKPLKSLGALEDLVTRIAGITGEARFDIGKRALVVMCADNGVIAQGVTQTDESITALVAADLAKGCSSANLMARVARVDVIPVDVGVKNPPDAPGLISPGASGGFFTPTSTGITSTRATRAIRLAEEQPFARSAATSAVIDSSVCVTPCAITPLSAHITTSARLPMSKRASPVIPAIRVTRSSSAPRLFKGLATTLHLSCEALTAASSRPVRRELISFRSTFTRIFSFDRAEFSAPGQPRAFFRLYSITRAPFPQTAAV